VALGPGQHFASWNKRCFKEQDNCILAVLPFEKEVLNTRNNGKLKMVVESTGNSVKFFVNCCELIHTMGIYTMGDNFHCLLQPNVQRSHQNGLCLELHYAHLSSCLSAKSKSGPNINSSNRFYKASFVASIRFTDSIRFGH
jgi:hypothetical protein